MVLCCFMLCFSFLVAGGLCACWLFLCVTLYLYVPLSHSSSTTWFCDMGEVQEGLESAFAAAEVPSGVAQPALGALRCWLCVNVHCPSSKGQPYGLVARQGVLSQNGNTRMGVGGDVNFLLLALRAGLPEADLRLHGDLAVALDGLVGIQEDSDIVKPLGGVSDAHDLVLVPLVRLGSGVPSQMVPLATARRPRQSHRWKASPEAWRASAAQRGKDPLSKAPRSAYASAAQPGQEELVILDEHEADHEGLQQRQEGARQRVRGAGRSSSTSVAT